MNIWELFGFKETPTGIGKVMSICMIICLVDGYFLEAFLDHIIIDVIINISIAVFFILLLYNFITKKLMWTSKKHYSNNNSDTIS